MCRNCHVIHSPRKITRNLSSSAGSVNAPARHMSEPVANEKPDSLIGRGSHRSAASTRLLRPRGQSTAKCDPQRCRITLARSLNEERRGAHVCDDHGRAGRLKRLGRSERLDSVGQKLTDPGLLPQTLDKSGLCPQSYAIPTTDYAIVWLGSRSRRWLTLSLAIRGGLTACGRWHVR